MLIGGGMVSFLLLSFQGFAPHIKVIVAVVNHRANETLEYIVKEMSLTLSLKFLKLNSEIV